MTHRFDAWFDQRADNSGLCCTETGQQREDASRRGSFGGREIGLSQAGRCYQGTKANMLQPRLEMAAQYQGNMQKALLWPN